MEILWFGVLALLLIGYFALEGFDLGVGLLLPVTADRDRAIGAIGPFVLANEVWLIAVAGVLFGAFPACEHALSANYTAVVLLLVSWVVRDMGLWFRRRLFARAFWEWVIALGSLGVCLAWGLFLAGLAGFSFPFGLLYGLLIAALFVLHGRRFLDWRLTGGGSPLVTGALAAVPALVPLVGFAGAVVGNAAPSATLTVMTFMVLPFVPVMAGAQIWVWRAFGKGPVPTYF
ncbi:cytochrome d ubiquinol oxidase subunit II [Herbidospora galbida]|uniref:Cytochrome d ubiquinol oxidase subunit II n=1 Tax=Herbidospora galbida TaxID=2575442 RepID=A0A4V5UXX2_9ACTN|nr:cytochrome d ubiquinol oxidase subunit II [Herbidospora galbida]TKK81083.1 cytochrome d ubiquinol oxidase subunit II [Herbidospora galbida]